jgi:hypothetical protein
MRTGARKNRSDVNTALNAVCPYFTMFPLEFPLRIFRQYADTRDVVLDPFAGRGTTLYAARMLGLPAFGIDNNPVAVAISQAKLANTTPGRIMRCAETIPYIYVNRIDDAVDRVVAHGGEVIKPPYPEGDLWVVTFRDPAGNVMGLWQAGPR